MKERNSKARGVLYHVVCAAPPAQQVQDFIALAQTVDWDVCVPRDHEKWGLPMSDQGVLHNGSD